MIVLTIGTFDMLHVGHLELIAACRRLGGLSGTVVVAVNTDEFVERFKGRRPITPMANRMEMLRALRDVDMVVKNTGDEYAGTVIDRIRPAILAVGDDWADKDYMAQLHLTHDFFTDRDIRIEYVTRTTGESTTAIRARLAVREAA